MSLRPEPLPPIPDTTAAAVRAAFPKGNLYVDLRAEFGTLYADGCRSHIDVGTLRPSAPGYAGAWEGRLTGHRHSGIRVLSHAPLLPEGSPHASIAEPCPIVQ
jgi:hypothetical protein